MFDISSFTDFKVLKIFFLIEIKILSKSTGKTQNEVSLTHMNKSFLNKSKKRTQIAELFFQNEKL